MNDYRVVQNYYADKGLYHKLIPEFTYADHVKAKRFIAKTAEENPDKTIVAVTHHGPSKRSIKPKYEKDFHMNGGYSSNLDEFIMDHPNIKFWTHGHTHDSFDYMIDQCRIICNPRGYSGYEERAREFDPAVGFDI
jgi:hypothetical protein